jgi:hypothetical protein
MFLLLCFLIPIGIALLLFIIEVTAIVKQSTYRPSVYLTRFGRALYNVFWSMANLLGIFADVFGFARRFILWVRDTFLRFIPREAIIQAFHDLRLAFREIGRSPLGLLYGLWDSIRDAAVPWLSATILLIGLPATLTFLEVILFVYGVGTRPSTCLAFVAVKGYNFLWAVGNIWAHVKNIQSLMTAIATTLFRVFFGWVDKEAVRISTHNLFHEGWNVVTLWHGLLDGLEAAGMPERIALGVVGTVIIIAACTVVYKLSSALMPRYYYDGLNYRWNLAANGAGGDIDDDDADDDDDDDGHGNELKERATPVVKDMTKPRRRRVPLD